MDVTTPTSGAAAARSSPENGEQGGTNNTNGSSETGNANSAAPNQTIGAAAAAQQPKVVQTAFIHKLYNMLEDQSIQHLISWSSSNESFVMSPTSEFSKVLAQYFKHTNISSFVRQLNMYGFHKEVSDVFHTGSPDSALWEFKHGNGNFKRGDLVGLREIKRRASRHALIHRDSFSNHKPGVPQQGAPSEPIHDATEQRFLNLEHSLYDMHSRLARSEESNAALSARCQTMADSLVKCCQWTHSMSHFLMALVPDRSSPLYRDVSNMQKDVERQLDTVRALENPHESLLSGRQPYFANMSIDPGPPLSPRQVPQDESRRPSMVDAMRGNIRPPVPQHLAVSPRRYGSIAAPNAPSSYNRLQVPGQQPPVPHPLSSVSSPPGPNLARRHTSADIRQHGWLPGTSPSGDTAGNPNSQWPPSPHRAPAPEDQQVREVLAQYEMGGPRRPHDMSRHATPPLTTGHGPSSMNVDNGWTIGGPKFLRHESSLPATRRSSMASNVHSLLNPAETAERPDEDEAAFAEDRKRKRLQ
ncbi:Flocculation suppression protein [Paecilomyces lecythidis]|uniref:Flocculation suppression protein n=1 Tax=Paecilomyces lecythidis TaxID=3004212 RepID=A0ABR3WRA5_9EURO